MATYRYTVTIKTPSEYSPYEESRLLRMLQKSLCPGEVSGRGISVESEMVYLPPEKKT